METQTEKKVYQTPILEQEKSFRTITGSNLPIGSFLIDPDKVLE